jgi:hypothetical protein
LDTLPGPRRATKILFGNRPVSKINIIPERFTPFYIDSRPVWRFWKAHMNGGPSMAYRFGDAMQDHITPLHRHSTGGGGNAG